MGILMVILGVLLIAFGISCAVTPLATLMAAGYFIAIVLIASGVSGIITGFRYKLYGSNFIVSILALLLGVLALVRPGGIKTIDTILIYLFAAWFVIKGISSLSLSLKLRKIDPSNHWIWGLIVGILGIALGIYSFIHPSVPAITIGLLISFYFIEAGFDTIATGMLVKEVTDTVDSIEKEVNDAVNSAADAVNSADSDK